jgi:hypothetical protein
MEGAKFIMQVIPVFILFTGSTFNFRVSDSRVT